MLLKKGTLWNRIVATTEQARASGALLPIATNEAYIDDNGIRFFVRVLAGLRRKDEARKKQESDSKAGKSINPFLPPEPELTVGEITETHTAVLNKFNVVEHHLLVITKQFEDQEVLLTPGDFEALWLCLREYNSLGFYNGGREAGASQRHKHLQLVPLPLAPEGSPVPVDPLLPVSGPFNRPEALPAFPFLHSFSRYKIDPATPVRDATYLIFDLYSRMLKSVNMEPPAASGLKRQSMPYCFLMTREWMLLVPRSREFLDDISFNSLAFAGSLFVRDDEQLRRLQSFGPMNALKAVAVEKGKTSSECGVRSAE
jgi:ATP adenylyltransferase